MLVSFSSVQKTSGSNKWMDPDRRISDVLLTRFISGDGELVAGLTLADQILSKHTDVVGGRRM